MGLLSAKMGTSEHHDHILRRVPNSNALANIPSSTSNFILVPVSLCKESLHIYRDVYGDDPGKRNSTFLPFKFQHEQLQLQVESLLIFSDIQEQILPRTQPADDCDLKHLYIEACHLCIENDAHSLYDKQFSIFYTDPDILFHFLSTTVGSLPSQCLQ